MTVTDHHSDDIVIADDPAEWDVDEELRERAIARPVVQNIGDFSLSGRLDKTLSTAPFIYA